MSVQTCGKVCISAYRIPDALPMRLVPAPREREWMERTAGAKRCLPLRMANQAGWWVLNPMTFIAEWTGEAHELGIKAVDLDGNRPPYVATNFGHGISTFSVPYLFRTEPGWSLLARGPANLIKHGIAPLEGLVETDWSIAPFTMNWRFTFPHVPVRFEAGEPVCQLVPMRRGELENLEPQVRGMPEPLLSRYREWNRVRMSHRIPGAQIHDVEAVVGEQEKWRGAYARGRFPDEEEKFPEHQTKLKLKPFAQVGEE